MVDMRDDAKVTDVFHAAAKILFKLKLKYKLKLNNF